jgi:excisionase family DNA binding protein
MQTAMDITALEETAQDEPHFLSAGQVAARLDVTPQTVYRWAKVGLLPAHRLGPRTLRFEEQDLEALLVPSMPPTKQAAPPTRTAAASVPESPDFIGALAEAIIKKLRELS